ncbi:tetratricopeptide repeat protein 1 [Magnaporthiopsis poae ATCC 64411]|uniref:Tetratricopeptide repeat protein 1 n=1 Tax=Magnaporthiopsis poae (strain ATCC 64411 / 73-15) TaxID=644358 RepID=A0A0C4DTN5_MAGP6|nr:tetratricopeptide repeat protein 1 [Magnaporthiopsis poae ATCC 64411]
MSQSTQNGGVNGGAATSQYISKRFSDVPTAIDVPVQDEDEAVEINLEDLVDDPTDLCDLFENESAARTYWMAVALAYAKLNKIDCAIEVLTRGGSAMQVQNPREKLGLVSCLCWMYLWKSREAPRLAPEGILASEAKTKEYYLQLATSTLNEASRINPAFPPLFLARGVLYLLRASLQVPMKSGQSGPVDAAKADLLRSALKSFEDAIRVSQGKNMLAVMGKSRALFSLGKYAEALAGYQDVLQRMPDMVDPDPRLGIGACFWQLGYKDDAKVAWERCLEINPDSKTANILLGLYYLDASGQVPTNSPEFIRLYKKAMTEYTQKSFKLSKDFPLTCATFAGYFLSRKSFQNVDSLAHKAIQFTDVNAIASDGWYLLARKEHYEGDVDKASDYYRRSDDARGGTERGYLPAKFGAAQLSVVKEDLGEAKLRLEKMIQQSRTYEAMILLGTLYAEEVFANQYATVKEDKSGEVKKAISLLEGVRAAWKDTKKNLAPDASVLLSLARLYEVDNPDRALQCLQQVEQLETEQIPEADRPTGIEDEAELRAAVRKLLPPQLLNNIGCFHSQNERHEIASDMFEAALGACMRIQEGDEQMDTDALVTTISYNLGRSYEARGLSDQAIEVYEGLLKRHDDYTDAKTRMAYLKLRKHPNKEGPDAVAKLYQEHPADLEVRALYGWYLGKVHSRKRQANIADDPELRHYRHTLQHYDKHDCYALVGMGNLYLASAREMRRETDQDKAKRSATYNRAVEFFEKALQLDPKNAYAAQGIAIALVEDRKDHKNALPIFLSVRDTIKDAQVYVNLGHIFAELRQFTKAIENYEAALAKEGKANDPSILACLGRTWLNKARSERDLDAYQMALECAKKALDVAPEQVHFKFNVAFVQIQLATTINGLSETQRSLEQLQDAAAGLEAAIVALDEIAKHPQTPYPKQDVEQRASMARNTQRKQLERAMASQKEYEEKNKEKLEAAKQKRQEELKRREEEKQKALDAERERQEKIRKEREEIKARDQKLAEQRMAAERAREAAEMTTDSETGEKVKRKRKAAARSEPREPRAGRGGGGRSRKKKADKSGDDESDDERQPKKKRRLTTKKENAKYKSAEIVVDSDEDGNNDYDALDRAEKDLENDRLTTPEDSDADEGNRSRERRSRKSGRGSNDPDDRMEVDGDASPKDNDDDDGAVSRPKRSRRGGGRVLDESDEDGDEGGGVSPRAAAAADTTMGDDDDE